MNSSKIEKSFIGRLLVQKDPGELFAEIDPADFKSKEAQEIFVAMRKLYEDGRKIDPVIAIEVVGEHVRDWVKDAVLADEFEWAVSWQEYARMIAESAQLERAQVIAMQIIDAGTIDEAREAAESLLRTIRDKSERDEHDMLSCLKETLAYMQEQPKYYRTGFGSLDKHAMISPGDMVVVGGRPSSGKTAFTLQIAAEMAKRCKVLYFSLETEPRKLTERLISSVSGVFLEKIKSRSLSDKDWEQIRNAGETIKHADLTFISAAGYDMPRIFAKAQKAGADVIFVDYLGLVKSTGATRYEQITNASIALHTFAQRTKISVFALCQLSRAAANGSPSIQDLRESGQIEQDADAVILLDYVGARENPKTTEYIVSVAKNKDGRTGDLRFRFYADAQRFYAEQRE